MAASRFPGPMQFDDTVTFAGALAFAALASVANPGTLGAVAYKGRVDLGDIPVLTGTGAPTGSPGVYPALYVRDDPADLDTLLYVCLATNVWDGAKLST